MESKYIRSIPRTSPPGMKKFFSLSYKKAADLFAKDIRKEGLITKMPHIKRERALPLSNKTLYPCCWPSLDEVQVVLIRKSLPLTTIESRLKNVQRNRHAQFRLRWRSWAFRGKSFPHSKGNRPSSLTIKTKTCCAARFVTPSGCNHIQARKSGKVCSVQFHFRCAFDTLS